MTDRGVVAFVCACGQRMEVPLNPMLGGAYQALQLAEAMRTAGHNPDACSYARRYVPMFAAPEQPISVLRPQHDCECPCHKGHSVVHHGTEGGRCHCQEDA